MATSARPREKVRPHPWTVLFGPWAVAVAIAVVLGAAVGSQLGEPGRLGVDLCWMRRLSGLPCPGCGLTRSVCHLARGDLTSALWFHPFGLLVLPFSLVAASSPLWPRKAAGRVRLALERRRRGVEIAYRAVVFAFLGFGALRCLAAVAGLWPAWS